MHATAPTRTPGSPLRRPWSRAAVVVAVTLGLALPLAACGTDEVTAQESDGPAEPARAPELTHEPEGTVSDVAPGPQGIVYDARSRVLAVAVRDPDRILLLDPRTLETTATVTLDGKVRHLQVARPGGPLLVPSETANELVEVSLPSGRTRRVPVEEHPHDAAAVGPDIFVGNEFAGSISVVRDGTVTDTISDLTQPGSVVGVGGDTVAAVDVEDYTLTTYDAATHERTGRVAAGEGPTHAVPLDDHRLAVVDTRGGEVLLFKSDPLRQVASVRTGGSPYGVVADPLTGIVWVTLTASNRLVGIDMSTADPRVVASYDTVRQPDTVAVAPGSHTVWVTGTADGVIQTITR